MATSPTDAPPASQNRALVAPVWHTILFLIAVMALTLLQAHQRPKLENIQPGSRLPLYGAQMLFELTIFAYVWLLGLKFTRTRVRDLIAGRWASAADVGRDAATALIFWLIVAGVLSALQKLTGENAEGLKAVKALLPQTPAEMAVWIVLCITAGFCEEFVFRGYLQRQFMAFWGRADLAIIVQAVVFGIAHGYQGVKSVIIISVYGGMFGILAMIRKSLRPGMIQHAGQDIFSGIVGGILARRHYF